jgi:hypothetical protein
MARQIVNVGPSPNSLDADALRNAFIKLNNNFQEIYNISQAIPDTIREISSEMIVNGSHLGITAIYDPVNQVINLTGFSGNYNDLINKPFTSTDAGSAASIYTPGDVAFEGGSSSAIFDPNIYNLNGGGA